MSYAPMRDGGPDYQPCHYGTNKPVFRGPEREVTANAIVTLGGTETFGKFIDIPWPERLELQAGKPVVNLGSVNAGLDLYLCAPHLLTKASAGAVTIIQFCGAAALTNRYYAVHPLRNDRFIEASASLQAIYRNVDFSDFHFIRHMLGKLAEIDAKRFEMLVTELQRLWVNRMQQLVKRVDGPVIGLWLADAAAPETVPKDGLGPDPLFVTAPMLDAVSAGFDAIVEVTPGAEAKTPDGAGRVFNQMDRMAAAQVYPARVHQDVADAVEQTLGKIDGA